MFVDELGVPVALQEHAEIIEPADNALQFHAIYKKYRDGNFALTDIVEKGVLQILFFGRKN